MAFIVEDGSGVSNANAYISTETADAYFAERGESSWGALSDPQKQVAIIKATDYVEQRWGALLRGVRMTTTQALHFPRFVEGMPQALQKAVCEYALRASKGPLAPDIESNASGQVVNKKSTKVGPITTVVEYGATKGSQQNTVMWRDYPAPDAMMRSLIRNTSMVIRA